MTNASSETTPSPSASSSGYSFGTFKGVFTPSILTILGVIMYLRLGWVLGQVGLWGTLVIITLSTLITALTALSIAALASNMKVGGGGAYYIISRSLGVETGGAVGLSLFLAQALGISFYVAGFSESLVSLFPFLSAQWVGIGILLSLAILSYTSADLALRLQYVILFLIVCSLISFFLGGSPGTPSVAAQGPDLSLLRQPFWAVFAVFFPAVTGIEAGLSLSGDLKNPARALSLGTIGAVGISYLIYLAIPIFLNNLGISEHALMTNPLIMKEVSLWGPLILVGLWGASFSSGLGAMLGAPRTLQALARDGVVPRILGRGFGPKKDPRLATAVSFLIGLLGVLLGDLNLIAPILAMFFLTSYGLLNLSAALEGIIASPSWRPQFNVPWWLSLLGAFGCFGVMLMINAGATILAGLVSLALYSLVRRRNIKAYWGDLRYGIFVLGLRYFIYRMAENKPDEKTWKPNILVLSGSPTTRWYLIALADAISHGKGFLTVATIVPKKVSDGERLENMRVSIRDYLKTRSVPALVKVHSAKDTLEGARQLIEAYGLGPVVPNTILLGETEDADKIKDYVRLVRTVYKSRRNLVIVREGEDPPRLSDEARIDLWWRTNSPNAGFMLALSHLLQTSPEWEDARIILHTIVEDEGDRAETHKGLTSFVDQSRLEVEIQVHVSEPGRDAFEVMRDASQGSNLVFLGMRAPAEEDDPEGDARYYQALMESTEDFPPVAIVLVAEKIEFGEIFLSSPQGY